MTLKRVALTAFALLIPGSLIAAVPRKPTTMALAARLRRITPESRVGHKPQAPVRIELVAGRVRPDGTQSARLVVTPLVDAEEVDVDVSADEGLRVLQGTPRWRAHARRKQPVHRDFILGSAPAAPGRRSQRLVVSVTMTFPMTGGETPEQRRILGTTVAWAVSPRVVTPDEAHPGSRRVRTRDGRHILEIPGE